MARNSGGTGLDDRGVGAGGGEYELSHVGQFCLLTCHVNIRNLVRQAVLAAVDEVVGNGVVVALRKVLGQILGEDVVTGRGQAVRAHAAVVALLVSGLSGR